MRLLNASTYELEEYLEDIPRYATLSHRWGKGEVTYQDVIQGRAAELEGWVKVTHCCEVALSRGLKYVWIDTCCIDKSSSAELTEAINSMYAWYQQSTECYAYLSDVFTSTKTCNFSEVLVEISKSVWFKRGWTLQELIAPKSLVFYNSSWEEIETRDELSQHIEKITKIDRKLLEGQLSISDFSIAQKMAWAAPRETTRTEDEAYCLLGIFEINMPLLYGEGRRAFRRLQEEIIRNFDDHTLFAWHDTTETKPILAPSVSCFEGLHKLRTIYVTNDKRVGHTMTNAGLNINLMLIPWAMDVYVAPLSCGYILDRQSDGQSPDKRNYRRMGIFLRSTASANHLERVAARVGGKLADFVLLDSDIVAAKRDTFGIEDHQVFLRQNLGRSHKETIFGLSFSFDHGRLFENGRFPTAQGEVSGSHMHLNDDLQHMNYGFVEGSSLQRILLRFKLAGYGLSSESRTFVYLGFDLTFRPVCLITRQKRALSVAGSDTELEGSTFSAATESQLPWLLRRVRDPSYSRRGDLLAFEAVPGTSTHTHCPELDLAIHVEKRDAIHLQDGQQMWHISFGYEKEVRAKVTRHHPQAHRLTLPRGDALIENSDEDQSTTSSEDSSISRRSRSRGRLPVVIHGARHTRPRQPTY